MEAKTIRIVYMGTPDFAVMPLRKLVESGYQIVGVVTSPDRPRGRGLKLQQSAIKQYALEVGLPILQPEKLKDPEFIEDFSTWKADLGIVIAFRMLPEVIWAMPKMGTFNLHASLLPDYRGAAPINWALINGEQETGVTTFMLNQEIDKGDILGRRSAAIDPEENVGALHDKLMSLGTDLVVETVEKIARGKASAMPQIESNTLKEAPKIFKEQCRIDWSDSAEKIHNLIRGLSPYPGAWTELIPLADERTEKVPIEHLKQPLSMKIFSGKIEPTTLQQGPPGTMIVNHQSELKIVCGEGILKINELQISGKKRMSGEELLRGFKQLATYRCH